MNNPKQVTINQLTALMDFLEEHPALALGQFQRSKEGRCLSRRLWEQCALALNALEAGSTRDAEGWREYFKAYKARFKKILSNHQKSLNATGGGPPAVLQLTPLQERLHAILGVDMGEPLPGVQHNPLSQTLTTEGTPLLAADSPSGSENVIVYCPVSSGVSVFDIDLPWAAESIPEPEGVQAPELALFEPDMALAPNPPLAPESAPAPAPAPIFGEGVPTSALTTTSQPAEARQRRRRRRPRTPLDEPATELAAAQARLERLEAEAAAATREVAAATREVAAATREDAAAAHRIATALERIATAMENESRPRKRRRRRISSSE